MKTKTRKLIAAITTTALLGSALGIGTYAFGKIDNSGFKGTYDLNAFAENKAGASTIEVMGQSIDTTSTLTLTSTNNDYTLFVTVVDTDDMSALAEINVGYTVGANIYNGKASGLSNYVYSSLTVNNSSGTTDTVTAADLGKFNDKITGAMLVIAEVKGVIAETPALTINALRSYTKDFSDGNITSNFFDIAGTTQGCGLTYNGKTYTKAIKTTSSGCYVNFNLTKAGTLNVLVASKDSKVPGVTIDGKKYERPDDNINTFYLVTVDLEAGAHEITKGVTNQSWLCYVNVVTEGEVNTDIPVTYTEVKEVPATCGKAGTAGYWLGSDGNKYSKSGDTYTLIEDESTLEIAATGKHSFKSTYDHDETNHWYACENCSATTTKEPHNMVDEDGVKTCSVCGYVEGSAVEAVTYTYTVDSATNSIVESSNATGSMTANSNFIESGKGCFKFGSNSNTITIKLSAKANQNVKILINGKSGSDKGDANAALALTNATLVDGNSSSLAFGNTAQSDATTNYTVTADSKIVITIKRDSSVGRTLRIYKVEVTIG